MSRIFNEKEKFRCDVKIINPEDKRPTYVIIAHTDIVNKNKFKKFSKEEIKNIENGNASVAKFDGKFGVVLALNILKKAFNKNFIIYFTYDGETEHRGAELSANDLREKVLNDRLAIKLVMQLDVFDGHNVNYFGKGVVVCKYPSSEEFVHTTLMPMARELGIGIKIINQAGGTRTDAEFFAKDFPTIIIGPPVMQIFSEQEIAGMKDISDTLRLVYRIFEKI